MEFKGTSGPWQLKHSESKNAWNVIGTKLAGRYKIARLPFHIHPDLSEEWNEREKFEQKANALLISKAPEMLEMLKECVDAIDWCMGNTTPANDDHSTFFNLCANAIDLSKKLIYEATKI